MIKKFLYDETGAEALEVGIITVILIAVALVFKSQLMEMATAIAEKLLG